MAGCNTSLYSFVRQLGGCQFWERCRNREGLEAALLTAAVALYKEAHSLGLDMRTVDADTTWGFCEVLVGESQHRTL